MADNGEMCNLHPQMNRNNHYPKALDASYLTISENKINEPLHCSDPSMRSFAGAGVYCFIIIVNT